ncbi:hypothetical protein VT99_13291, partial [Candidatus Electrothrix marina]
WGVWQRAVSAAKQFTDTSPRQFGAPLYCIAVEENIRQIKKVRQGVDSAPVLIDYFDKINRV